MCVRHLEMSLYLLLFVSYSTIVIVNGQCPTNVVTGFSIQEYNVSHRPDCLGNANKTYHITLEDSRAVTSVAVNTGNLLSTRITYSYNSSNWYEYRGSITKPSANTLAFDPPIFLKNLLISLGPFSNTSECLNAILTACIEDTAPEVSFQSSADDRFYESYTLSCTINGQPYANIVWRTSMGFTFLPEYVTNRFDVNGDHHTSTLRLTKERLSKDGFKCRNSAPPCMQVNCISNYPGSTRTRSVAKSLNVFPDSPIDFRVKSARPKSVFATWNKPKGDFIMNYTSFGLALTSSLGPRRDNIRVTDLRANKFDHEIAGLKPCTYYAVEISSVNYLGESSWIKSNFTTTAGLLGITLHVNDVSWSSADTAWTLEEKFGDNCQINNATAFVIRYRCITGFSDLSLCKSWLQTNASRNSRNSSIGVLNPATKYEVYVSALTTQPDFNVTSKTLEFITNDTQPSGVPTNLKLAIINTTAIMLSWDDIKPEEKHGAVLYFKAEVYEADENVMVTARNFSSIMVNGTMITGLRQCTNYTFFLSGCNSAGCGPTGTMSMRTLDKPIEASFTLNIHLNESDPYTISVVAAVVGNLSSEMCLTGVVVQYKEMSAGNFTHERTIPHNESVSIYGLQSFSTYHFRSRLQGFSSFTNWSTIVQVRTAEGVPSAVTSLNVDAAGNLAWKAPLHPQGIIQNYSITVRGTRSYNESFSHSFNASTNQPALMLGGLLPATRYNVTVRARNAKYEGSASTFTYETEALPPLKPTSVRFDDETIIFTMVKATVKAIPDVNGPVTEYQVIVVQRRPHHTSFVDRKSKIPSYDEALALNQSYYLALRMPPFSGTRDVFIGDANRESGLFNAPLNRNENYTILIRAVTTWKGKTLYSAASAAFLDRYPVKSRPAAVVGGQTKTSVSIKLVKLDSKVQYVRIIVRKTYWDKDVSSIPNPEQYQESNITVYSISKRMQLTVPYVTAELSKAKFEKHKHFVIGDGNRTSKTTSRRRRSLLNSTLFWNGPLDPGSSYIAFFRVYHNDLVYFSSSWSDPFKTLPLPTVEAAPKGSSVGLIIGVVICVLAIPCFIIVGILLWKRNKKAFKANYRFSTMELMANGDSNGKGTANLSFSEDVFEPDTNSIQSSDFVLKHPIDPSHPAIAASDFTDYLDAMKDKDYAFEDEFQEISDCSSGHKREAKKQANVGLNRDSEAVPFDHSRVLLDREKKGASDYINAAWVDGYSEQNAYIATQAPLSETVKDFWMMVWQQNVRTIVVLTHVLDEDKTESPCYWPTSQRLVIGDLVIEGKDTVFDDCSAVRAFILSSKKMPGRLVRHFQFNKWPERGIPNSVKDLLNFRDLVNQWHRGKNGTQIIHCSNGSGRSGTYIALDAVMKNLHQSKQIDIFNYVNYLRSRRTNMVETDRQYEFIYDALQSVLTKIDRNTEMTKRNAKELHRSLVKVDPLTGCTGFTKIFKNLHRGLKTQSSVIKRLEGSKAINDYKNRYSFKVPHDSFRVRLPVFGSTKSNSSDYINATYVSLSDSSRFITTQAPFGITINDFWNMVHFSRADAIVSLNDLDEGPVSFSQFWPGSETTSAVYGNFRVSLELETTPFPCVIRRDFTLAELAHPDATREVSQFHMLGWEEHDIPSSRIAVLELCKYIANEYMAEDKPPVIIQCSDGFGRSGTFSSCVEAVKKLSNDGIVDVQNIVRKFKERNASYVENEAQFKFIFDIVLDFAERCK